MPVHDLFEPQSDAEIQSCFAAFHALRPHISEPDFLPQVRRQQNQGYRIVALRLHGEVVCVAGFRLAEFLAWGRVVYIDDLSTVPQARGQGCARAVLERVVEWAREQDCVAVHLDSGYTRHAAHKLYLRCGFEISAHHMTLALS